MWREGADRPRLSACKTESRCGWIVHIGAVCAQGQMPRLLSVCIWEICPWVHTTLNVNTTCHTVKATAAVSLLIFYGLSAAGLRGAAVPSAHTWTTGFHALRLNAQRHDLISFFLCKVIWVACTEPLPSSSTNTTVFSFSISNWPHKCFLLTGNTFSDTLTKSCGKPSEKSEGCHGHKGGAMPD